jgi:hypothetical protein
MIRNLRCSLGSRYEASEWKIHRKLLTNLAGSVGRLIRNLRRPRRPAPIDRFLERPAKYQNNEDENNADQHNLPLRNSASRTHARCHPDAGCRGEPLHVMAFLASDNNAGAKKTNAGHDALDYAAASVPVTAWIDSTATAEPRHRIPSVRTPVGLPCRSRLSPSTIPTSVAAQSRSAMSSVSIAGEVLTRQRGESSPPRGSLHWRASKLRRAFYASRVKRFGYCALRRGAVGLYLMHARSRIASSNSRRRHSTQLRGAQVRAQQVEDAMRRHAVLEPVSLSIRRRWRAKTSPAFSDRAQGAIVHWRAPVLPP